MTEQKPQSPKCLNCGKKMFKVYDDIAGKFTGYLWRCECIPDGISAWLMNNSPFIPESRVRYKNEPSGVGEL